MGKPRRQRLSSAHRWTAEAGPVDVGSSAVGDVASDARTAGNDQAEVDGVDRRRVDVDQLTHGRATGSLPMVGKIISRAPLLSTSFPWFQRIIPFPWEE